MIIHGFKLLKFVHMNIDKAHFYDYNNIKFTEKSRRSRIFFHYFVEMLQKQRMLL